MKQFMFCVQLVMFTTQPEGSPQAYMYIYAHCHFQKTCNKFNSNEESNVFGITFPHSAAQL